MNETLNQLVALGATVKPALIKAGTWTITYPGRTWTAVTALRLADVLAALVQEQAEAAALPEGTVSLGQCRIERRPGGNWGNPRESSYRG